jgi:hypothetical protein
MKVIILSIFLFTSVISFSQDNSEKKSETETAVKKENPKTRTVKAKVDKDGNVISKKEKSKKEKSKKGKLRRRKTIRVEYDKEGNEIPEKGKEKG